MAYFLERLLALVIPKDKPKEEITIFDPFGGSFSTMEAVYNMGMKGISCEIDKEYFDLGKERIEKLPPHQTALFDFVEALRIHDVVGQSEQLSCGRNITTCVFYKEGGKCSNLEYCRDQTT